MTAAFAHEHSASHWVLVADQSRAKIFSVEKVNSGNAKDRCIEFVEKLDHPESRMHDGDLVTDSHGASQSSTSASQRAMSNSVEPTEHEAEVFAKEVAEHLNDALEQQRYKHLTLVAGPVAMGLIRSKLSGQVEKSIVAEYAKNLSQASTSDIEKTLGY